MAFPWDSLIAAAAGVIGGLGGAGVTGYLANKREEAAADRTEFAAEENRRRDAYAGLLVTSRAALRNLRQLRIAYASGTPNTADVAAVFARGTDVAADMNNATAIAELLGSDEVRPCAVAIYDKAKACADYYQDASVNAAGLGKAIRVAPASFDPDYAERLCDELAAAIAAFAAAARNEIAG
jgi:hypothetical protein